MLQDFKKHFTVMSYLRFEVLVKLVKHDEYFWVTVYITVI